jgi:lipopolysaccharide transport system permease protein
MNATRFAARTSISCKASPSPWEQGESGHSERIPHRTIGACAWAEMQGWHRAPAGRPVPSGRAETSSPLQPKPHGKEHTAAMTTSAYRLTDPTSPYRALTRHFALVVQMARRDVAGRYRGAFCGLLWSFFNPLLMLVIYTFVFGVIFKSRWNAQTTDPFQYAMVLFAGLNINTLFSESANRATTLVIENTNFVKRVVFPLETLSWSTLGSGLFHLCVSTIVLLSISPLVLGHVPWTVVLFPIVVVCFLPFVAGTVWMLASLGVYLRDLKQATGIVTTALMFLAPILYPAALIPERWRFALYFNPLTIVAEASQDVLIWGRLPRWDHLAAYAVIASLFAWLAFAWFERTRKGFADVV